MKILIILRKFKGGIGKANTEIAEVLRKKGHQVDFLSREDDLKKYSLIKGILPIRKKVKQIMKKENYNIIYTQDYSIALPLLFPYLLFWKKHFCCFCGIKTRNHPNLIQFHHKFLHRLVGKIMGKKLVVIGNQLKEAFPKSTLIYRGVNMKKFKSLKKKRNSIGWYYSDNETISLKEIRDISNKTKLKLLIFKNISPEKMNDFYNECKVFINLPRTAGFNLSWLEAMAAGIPTIIGNYKGAGIFLPIEKVLNDEENKVDKIIKIIRKPKRINYRKWLIDNNFTWENKTEELIKFFEKFKKNV